ADAACIFTSTCPSFGTGFSTSFKRRTSGPPYAVFTIAFIFYFILLDTRDTRTEATSAPRIARTSEMIRARPPVGRVLERDCRSSAVAEIDIRAAATAGDLIPLMLIGSLTQSVSLIFLQNLLC